MKQHDHKVILMTLELMLFLCALVPLTFSFRTKSYSMHVKVKKKDKELSQLSMTKYPKRNLRSRERRGFSLKDLLKEPFLSSEGCGPVGRGLKSSAN